MSSFCTPTDSLEEPNKFNNANYTGLGDVGDDYAIVSYADGWQGTYAPVRLMTSGTYTGTSVWMVGYGANNATTGAGQGVQRLSTSTQTIDETNSSYFRIDASTAGQACKGDSGGPVINTNLTPYNLSLGVFSELEGSGNPLWCGTTAARYPRHNGTWVQTNVASLTGETCTYYSYSGTYYYKCW